MRHYSTEVSGKVKNIGNYAENTTFSVATVDLDFQTKSFHLIRLNSGETSMLPPKPVRKHCASLYATMRAKRMTRNFCSNQQTTENSMPSNELSRTTKRTQI